MKKLIFILVLFICTPAFSQVTTLSYVTPEDVSIDRMESNRVALTNGINSFDGSLVQSKTITPDALGDEANPVVRWNEAFNDWVSSGLTIPTSASLSSTTTSGVAYISGVRVAKDATVKSYTASKWTFVDLGSDGVYDYDEQSIDTSDTSIETNHLRIARVSTDGTTVFAVRDDRILAISLDSAQEDFRRAGFNCKWASTTTINVDPGSIYLGTQHIIKNAVTTLNINNDWVGGQAKAANTKGYIGINSSGQLKLTTTAPTKHNIGGDTAGELRISTISSVDYRIVGWFFMNSDQEFQDQWVGAWKDNATAGDIIQVVKTLYTEYADSTGEPSNPQVPNDDTAPLFDETWEVPGLQTKIIPTNSNNWIQADVTTYVGAVAAQDIISSSIYQDGSGSDAAKATGWCKVVQTSDVVPITITTMQTADTTGVSTYDVGLGNISGDRDVYLNGDGVGGAAKMGGTFASTVILTEIKR